MKPCSKNRKLLGWLAINALEDRPAAELRTHLENCPGCRRYLEEMAGVAGNLTRHAEALLELEPSTEFHHKLARRITAENRSGIWAVLQSFLPSTKLNWRLLASAAGVSVAIVAALFMMRPSRERQLVARVAEPVALNQQMQKEPAQTFGSYRMLANRSLDALDSELTSEVQAGPTSVSTTEQIRNLPSFD